MKSIVNGIFLVFLLAPLLYLSWLLMGALIARWFSSSREPYIFFPKSRFFIAIAAHNEEKWIEANLDSLIRQSYPSHLFDVYVVADHCQDKTFELASKKGVYVANRTTGPTGSKSLALRWLFRNYLTSQYDAVVIFDADSVVDPAFLRRMNDQLLLGENVIQGRHAVSNGLESIYSGLAAISIEFDHVFFNTGRNFWGLSGKIMGDGVCIRRQLINKYWRENHLTEDAYLRQSLINDGYHICYEYRAVSKGRAVRTLNAYRPQMSRWLYGVMGVNKVIRRLFLSNRTKVSSISFDKFDMYFNSILPGFSFLLVLYIVYGLAALTLVAFYGKEFLWIFLGSALLLVWLISLSFTGLALAGVPRRYFVFLLAAPVIVIAKLNVLYSILVSPTGPRWVKTER